ncbi:MAG: class I SAM-dependent methyltransferase [Acidobacteriaceae bacterium]
MDLQAHWEQLYERKAPDETRWYDPHLRTSLEWVRKAAPDLSASIIDIGGGESTLVDDLLSDGYLDLTVIDLANAAILKSQKRLGSRSQSVTWLVGDVTKANLPFGAYDVWHDRAVFHFLIQPEQRSAYVRQLISALKSGGSVVMATFGPDGPQMCSGLDTMRYDHASLADILGPQFCLIQHSIVNHRTPFGTTQQFLYCHFSFDPQKGIP